jgi:hypothetical protein
MSGETEREVSGWTVDTLRDYVKDTLRADQQSVQNRFSALESLLQSRFNDQREMLNERYNTQTKALDAAFVAQQTAMRTALETADKAVQAALISAEKAVGKAEIASEKRFESVNEFRAQLTDQAATFLSRAEYEGNHKALADKFETQLSNVTGRVDIETKRADAARNDLELRLTSRLDLMQGSHEGAGSHATEQRLNIGTLLQTLAIIATIIGLIIVAFHK